MYVAYATWHILYIFLLSLIINFSSHFIKLFILSLNSYLNKFHNFCICFSIIQRILIHIFHFKTFLFPAIFPVDRSWLVRTPPLPRVIITSRCLDQRPPASSRQKPPPLPSAVADGTALVPRGVLHSRV